MAKIFSNEVLIICNIELFAGNTITIIVCMFFGSFVFVSREFRQELFYSSVQDILPFAGCWS